jgi:hypothetical protein
MVLKKAKLLCKLLNMSYLFVFAGRGGGEAWDKAAAHPENRMPGRTLHQPLAQLSAVGKIRNFGLRGLSGSRRTVNKKDADIKAG